MLVECVSQFYIVCLMLMYIVYKVENGFDICQENGIVKVFLVNMVYKVVDMVIQLYGVFGYLIDMLLVVWYIYICL